MKIRAFAIAILACLLVTGCGHKLSGTYVPKGGGIGNGLVMSKLEFISSTEVNIYMMEQTFRANYKIDGKQVLLIVNGQQEVFNIDSDGCLDGGNLFGKFCKS
ncbi:MAG TPA: hypothetical protein VGR40_05635 [Candidatus Binatus sp.]|nr:hypothetical protein [Candidatus Binatus sp.]